MFIAFIVVIYAIEALEHPNPTPIWVRKWTNSEKSRFLGVLMVLGAVFSL